jgi:hypothetical protein
MKGFIKQAAAGICFGAGLFTVLGCTHYREATDPCWMARYNSMSEQSVREISMAQAAQGHKLEQTVWNAFFERDAKTDDGTAILNGAGQDFLHNIARRQPVPDFHLWLQYANDVKDPTRRDAVGEQRKLAIRNYLTKETKLSGGDLYQVDVHDLAMPTYIAEWTVLALQNIEKTVKTGKEMNFTVPSASSGGSGASK